MDGGASGRRDSPRYRVDIEGGAVDDPPDRELIAGPLGCAELLAAVLCAELVGAVVGFGAVVGCGLLPLGVGFGELFDAEAEACESLIDPACLPDADPSADGASADNADPPGARFPALRGPVPPPALLTPALFVNCPGGWLTGLLQAPNTAQTRAAATAVAAALAGATVPRLGMHATVAK